MEYPRNRHARRLFDGIAERYDLLAEAFSFLQYGRWRRYLVSRLNVGPGHTVLDLCTGTAGIALDIGQTFGCRVVGVDLSKEMLNTARRKACKAGVEHDIALLMGRAESLAFNNDCFDAVCFTFLLRYVEEPEATLGEIVRVLKPGGSLVSLEFGVPDNVLLRGLWRAYTGGVLPLGTGLVSRNWKEVGSFLGPSISRFYQSYTIEHIKQMWTDLGIEGIRVKRLSLGGAIVMWGTKVGTNRTKGQSLGDVQPVMRIASQ